MATEDPTKYFCASWSQRYYPGLTPRQHNANNIWFRNMLEMLKDSGTLVVPGIEKVFNKQGEEISGL